MRDSKGPEMTRMTNPLTRKAIAVCLPLWVAAAFGTTLGQTPQPATSDEMRPKSQWINQYFSASAPRLPFSFNYGGQPSAELLAAWPKKAETRTLDNARTQQTLTWTDPKTNLSVRCVVVDYADLPMIEWTLYFENAGQDDTPLISEVMALDLTIKRASAGEFIVHRTVGDGGADIYKPDPITLAPGQAKRFAPNGGRPCSTEFPYFNVQSPEGGWVIAIGWPGQWSASFIRDDAESLHVTAGQEITRFKLLPGEELRSPLVVLEPWKSDHRRAQNLWRRWMNTHNSPRPGGKRLPPQLNVCNANQFGYFGITEENQRAWIQRYQEENIAYDYWWCDLSWFALDDKTYVFNALYDPDPVRFPRGLKSLSNYLHQNHIKLIAWFEPEHYYPGPGNWIVENHPEWLLKAPPGHEAEINQGMPLKNRTVLNLGNPEALKWVTDNTDRVLREQGIDYYRHDFNIEPLIFWRANDPPDRQGVTEIKYVTGFLAYYDELIRRHPQMPIDNCASGGRRNDVETLRRSVPLLRSDTWGEPVGQQCQTYGLADWIPFWGTGIMHSDPKDLPYIFRSQMGPSFTSCWDLTPKANYDLHRKLLDQWCSLRVHILNGDYYPLTPYSASGSEWMAWQYHRPDQGEGVVQAFRRAQANDDARTFQLNGLAPGTDYIVENLDTGSTQRSAGAKLMGEGLRVNLGDRPAAALFVYRPVQ